MNDNKPRVGTELPADDPCAKQDTQAAMVAMIEALPVLVAAARSGELAGLIVGWPPLPLASVWCVSFAPTPSGVRLDALRYVGSPLFDLAATHGVASVEWRADHIAAIKGGVSSDDLAFLRDTLGELCQAHQKQGKPQIS